MRRYVSKANYCGCAHTMVVAAACAWAWFLAIDKDKSGSIELAEVRARLRAARSIQCRDLS